MPTVPTFFIAGAAKCGTTTLYGHLSDHPAVCMAHPKEPEYFYGHEYHRGLEYYWQKYFRHFKGEPEIGEAAHRILYLPFAARRVRETVTDARFIVACREPVSRAWSHYTYARARGDEPRSFEDALAVNFRRLETGPHFHDDAEAALYGDSLDHKRVDIDFPSYVDSGHYAEQIRRYQHLFGSERVKVLLFDDLVADPQRTMNEILQFLGLPPQVLREATPANPLAAPFVYGVYKTLGRLPGIDRIPGEWRDGVKTALARTFAARKPDIEPRTAARLRQHYRVHNDALATLIGRDLSHWNGGSHAR